MDFRARLSATQTDVLSTWLPEIELIADMSWNLVDTIVLHVAAGGREYVVKAAGASNHHIAREIDGHRTSTAGLVAAGRAARMVHADAAANILVTEYLKGRLCEGTDSEFEPDVHHQAGLLLRVLHQDSQRTDDTYESVADAKALAWLQKPHRIPDPTRRRVEAILRTNRPVPTRVVPTHGDWHPRNWLVDNGTVRVIDFGRFAFRTPASDLCRLSAQQWRGNPSLEAAFLSGYGPDPRRHSSWALLMLREAVGTTVWAHQVGDLRFEQQGLRMITDALELI